MEVKTKKSYWRLGKEQNKEFVELKFKRLTSFKTLALGIIVAALILLPMAIIVFQFIQVYWYYSPKIVYLFLSIAFGLLMIANAISNYVTVKATKLIQPNMDNLQKIDAGAIFFYQLLNPWFALFIMIILLWFGCGAL